MTHTLCFARLADSVSLCVALRRNALLCSTAYDK